MIDFRKRLAKPAIEKSLDPLEIYERLDRASDKGPLRPSQQAILKEWHIERRNKKDVILKLNTGQGKTLVGLLMLQSKLNENEGAPALYLCPNNFLVNQTITQAKQFGIACVKAEGDLPAEFLDGKSILVTSVQKLFNGLSKFKLGAQAIRVNSIVIDDAHTCIDSIKDAYTIHLDNSLPEYQEILELFASALEGQGAGTYLDILQKDFNAFLPVPYWEWYEHHQEVTKILGEKSKTDAIKFAWPLIKDNIRNCLCIVSGQGLAISPYLPPLDMFGSYDRAQHRIFMSATITDDSFLIKGLGLSEEAIKNPLVYKDEKWSGEKMILIPSLIDSSLTEMEIAPDFAKPSLTRNGGSVVLCPSFQAAKMWEAAGAYVASKKDIYERVEMLKNGHYNETLVIANRYDGIDLPDNACRILILASKPFSEDLIDRYIETCRENSVIIAVKTSRTIEQGLGRSVRGEKDYSVIVLLGNDLVRCVRTKDARKYFSAQTCLQIEIGLEIASFATEQITEDTPPDKILKNLIFQCLRRDAGWKEFYTERMNTLTSSPTSLNILHIFSAEMKAEQKYHDGSYDEAARILQNIIDTYSEVSTDKGWYLQDMARYTYPVSKARSNDLQVSAHKHNRYLLKPKAGMIFSKIPPVSQKRMENIINYIRSFVSFEELWLSIEEVTGNLKFGIGAEKFERSLDELAKALGFIGQRPDKEWKEGPDNLWALRDTEYMLFECKSEVQLTRQSINKEETGQMNNASAWFKKNYLGAPVKHILIIPTKNLGQGAGFTENVEILRERGLRQLTNNVKAFFTEFKNVDFGSLSENHIQTLIDGHKLSVSSLVSEYSEAPKSS